MMTSSQTEQFRESHDYRSLVVVESMSDAGVFSVFAVLVIGAVGPVGLVESLHAQGSQQVSDGHLQSVPRVRRIEHFGSLKPIQDMSDEFMFPGNDTEQQ